MKSKLIGEQYGDFHRRLDDFIRQVDEPGGILYEVGMIRLQAIMQDFSTKRSFDRSFEYQWVPDNTMIIVWNIFASISPMAAATLPAEYQIEATFSKSLDRHYHVNKGLPDVHKVRQYNFTAYDIEFGTDGNWWNKSSPQSSELFAKTELRAIVEEFQVKIDLDNPPAEWMFMLPDGRLIWVEQPKKSKAEYIGESIMILAELRNVTSESGRIRPDPLDEEIKKALKECGWTIYGDSWQFYRDLLDYVLGNWSDKQMDWEKLHPRLIEIKNKYLKE